MFRSENAISVFSYLAGDPAILKLRRVAANGLNEYSYSKLLPRYAHYLEDRVLAFRELGYDVVLASKRDRFARLRKLSVSQGLFKEITMIQRVVTSLLRCSFLSDEFRDEITEAALHMTLKDLFAYYMGMNEGIINMLEHYFEMSKPDAERSLELYRRFCFQTENVHAFLNAAKRHSHYLRSSIPNLKHAPLSLANALEEYLHETDFSKHESASKTKELMNNSQKSSDTNATLETPATATSTTQAKEPESATVTKKSNASSKQALQDFFESLEQPNTPFNSAYAFCSGFNAQSDWFGTQGTTTNVSPFGMSQVTSNPFGPQPTGMAIPQMTGYNPFSLQMPLIQPQAPLVPQHTMPTTPFDSIFGQMSLNPSPAIQQPQIQAQSQSQSQQQQQAFKPQPQPHLQTQSQPQGLQPTDRRVSFTLKDMQPFSQRQSSISANEFHKASQHTHSLRTQKTGTLNPFSIPSDFEEPKEELKQPPKPTLNELAFNAWQGKQQQQPITEPQAPRTPEQLFKPSATSGGFFGQVASEFTGSPTSFMHQNTASKASDTVDHGAKSMSTSQTTASLAPQHSRISSTNEPKQVSSKNVFSTSLFSPNTSTSQASGSSLMGSGAASSLPFGTKPPQGLEKHDSFLQPQSTLHTSQKTGLEFPHLHRADSLPVGPGSGLGIGLNSQHTGLQSPNAFTGASSGTNSPFGLHGTTSNFPSSMRANTLSPMELQSQITGLTGIKPFQPSSAYGTSLFSGQITPGSGLATSTSPLSSGDANLQQQSAQSQPSRDLLQL